MTKLETKEIEHGLYRIFWKEGGSSLAAIGSAHNGDRWVAPCNWTSGDIPYPKVATTMSWNKIDHIEAIQLVTNYGFPDGDSL